MRGALPPAVRRVAVGVGLIALLVAGVHVSVGGFRFEAFGVRISNRSLARPLLMVLAAAALVLRRSDRAATRGDLQRIDGLIRRAAPWIAAGAAAAALVVGVVRGTHAAGGSDSYCYIGQAEAFAAGRTLLVEPLASELTLPRTDFAFAPVGFVPGPQGGAVPMCAPGLSLVMAIPWKVGGDAALHLVVPCLGALCVWCAFLLARRLHGAAAGAYAAALVCASPVFLYQVVQPMSDVPAAAFWSAAIALAGRGLPGSVGAGVLVSVAILTRPNLAPVLVPLVIFVVRAGGRAALWRFAIALAPGCALLAWLNTVRYGSPLRTGYGDVEALFSLANVWPNASRYAHWTIAAQTPFVLLAFAAPLLLRAADGRPDVGRLAWTSLGIVVVVIACYLPYTVFDAWWYTRFLLPALPVALALASAALAAVGARLRLPEVLPLIVVLMVAAAGVAFAWSHHAFTLRDFERRFVTAGTYVARELPPNAVLITIQQSGSVRHYGGRPALLWDALPPDGLDEAVAELERVGRRPIFLLEDGEEQGFRQRFITERLGALDWGPVAELPGQVTVRFYDPRERPK